VLTIIGLAALLAALAIWGFNSLAKMRNVVSTAWADVDVQLKRRSDLIPNLVETAKGYSGFERTVLNEVVEARSKALGVANPADRAQAEQQVAGRLGQIIAIAEQYPELKASAQFIRLQTELSETETKIASSRQYYNAAVRDYNTIQDQFPLNMIAGMFGFKHGEFFSADEPERQTPEARFNP
jgi:LemA protein